MLLALVVCLAGGSVDPADDAPPSGVVVDDAAVVVDDPPVTDTAVPRVDDRAPGFDPADDGAETPTTTTTTTTATPAPRPALPDDDVLMRDAFAVGAAACGSGCLGACAPLGCSGVCPVIGVVSPVTACAGAVGGVVSAEQAFGMDSDDIVIVGGAAAAGVALGGVLGVAAGLGLSQTGGFTDVTSNVGIGAIVGAATAGVGLAGAFAFAAHVAVHDGPP